MNKSTAQTAPAVLNHIAVYVADLDKSGNFYESLLNLKKIEEPFKDGKHIWFSLGSAGQMHLIQGAKSGLQHDKNEHICFSVSSVTEFMTKLDKEKISYSNWPGTEKAPTIRPDGVKQIYFQDPDGHWLEVNDQKL
ncbi:MAG TPA: VOC family protein [Pedobacter sp.]